MTKKFYNAKKEIENISAIKCNKRKFRNSWNCGLQIQEKKTLKIGKVNSFFMHGYRESFDKIMFEHKPKNLDDSFKCILDEDGYIVSRMAVVTDAELRCGFTTFMQRTTE